MTTPDVRRAGNGSGKITREAVLAAALEIIDRDGADALSMRRLARALDRDPMILYRHVPPSSPPTSPPASTWQTVATFRISERRIRGMGLAQATARSLSNRCIR